MAQSVDVRWNTEREGEVTLDAIRAFVAEVAGDLDAGSRYIRELNAALDAATSVDDYLARLDDRERLDAFRRDGSQSSKGERGRSWLDAETWAAMDPFERTLSNLLTGETRMMWAGDGAPDFACLAEVLSDLPAPRRALSIPCSTGKEAFSLAIAALRADIELSIVGVDRQPAYVKRASSGLLVQTLGTVLGSAGAIICVMLPKITAPKDLDFASLTSSKQGTSAGTAANSTSTDAGVSQEEYDAVKEEIAQLQAKLEATKG